MNKIWIKANWPAPDNICAGTTLRIDGVSQNTYSSFNLASHVGDDFSDVLKNRQRLVQKLNLPQEPLWIEQTHSSKVICIDQKPTDLSADACYSLSPGNVCAVLTADCLPVLICNQQGTKVAAIHAGWRGLLTGIVENTVLALNDPQLIAWLGPAIGPKCFEVGDDVHGAFCRKFAKFSSAFQIKKPEKWLFDIYALVRMILTESGVQNIYGGGYCTMTDHQQFFSYRRDGTTGRMASLIWRT